MCMDKRLAIRERRTKLTKNPPTREGVEQVYYFEHNPFHRYPEQRKATEVRRQTDSVYGMIINNIRAVCYSHDCTNQVTDSTKLYCRDCEEDARNGI